MDQPRNRHAPMDMVHVNLEGGGLGRHGHASVVGTPRTTASGGGARYGYAFSVPPTIRGRGAPNAGRCIPATGC